MGEWQPKTARAWLDGFADGAIFFASSVELHRARAEVMQRIMDKFYSALAAAPPAKEDEPS